MLSLNTDPSLPWQNPFLSYFSPQLILLGAILSHIIIHLFVLSGLILDLERETYHFYDWGKKKKESATILQGLKQAE